MRSLGLLGLLSLSFLTACSTQQHYEDAEAPAAGQAKSRRSSPDVAPRDWSRADRASGGGFAGEAEAPAGAAPGPSDEALGTRWDGGDLEADAIARERSPGLGTAYGETRSSSVDTVAFHRADTSPDVVFAIRYDDAEGVRQVARSHRTRAFADEAMQRQGDLTFGLLDAEGHVLSAASVGSDLYALGEPDARYSLALANDSNTSYEVVLSVDGLDVIDGRPAGFDKRGYVIDPFSSLVIEGWRTSEDTVAAFRFSSIEDSYADRTGEGRNIGVIGAAFFREAPRHWEEWRAPEDTWRRETADPFPGSR